MADHEWTSECGEGEKTSDRVLDSSLVVNVIGFLGNDSLVVTSFCVGPLLRFWTYMKRFYLKLLISFVVCEWLSSYLAHNFSNIYFPIVYLFLSFISLNSSKIYLYYSLNSTVVRSHR